MPEHIFRFKEFILNYEIGEKKYLKISELLSVSHFEDDFMKAIDKLSISASCGPDGWSASLVKGLKISY